MLVTTLFTLLGSRHDVIVTTSDCPQVDDNCEQLGINPIHCAPKDTHILPFRPWLTVT